jgi:glucose-6-phosphate dehydrogenase assembly protein OpcA
MTYLEDTDASAIANALVAARRNAGSPAMGMVMTLVVVAAEDEMDEALDAARAAAREHPSRLLGVVLGSGRGTSAISADIRAGAGSGGELALIRLEGPVAKHAESVVLPLLLPDSPVVVWWPHDAPADPAADPVGRLGNRRITDAAQVSRGAARAMLSQCRAYAPGNTDLAWTRITPWRALLASAMDQASDAVSTIEVTAERVSPSADLLAAWLSDRLGAPVKRKTSDGPGITDVVLAMKAGDIRVARADGRLATLSVPGQPDRPVALRRRTIPDLLTEELRRLDPDDVYAATAERLAALGGVEARAKTTKKTAAKKSAAKKTATKKTATKKSTGKTAKKSTATTAKKG